MSVAEETHEWAYTVQHRYAEKIGVAIARGNTENITPIASKHNIRIQKQLKRLGVNSEDTFSSKSKHGLARLTPYDDPEFRKLLESSMEKIAEVIETKNELLSSFVISTLPSGSISALIAANTWDNKKYIFVDVDISNFSLLLSKIVALCFPKINCESDIKFDFYSDKCIKISRNESIFKDSIVDLFKSASVLGCASGAKPWVMPDKGVYLAGILAESMNIFIIAHEVAHGILGHLEAPDQTLSSEILDDGVAMIMSHADELDADREGLSYSMAALAKTELSPIYAVYAAYIFFQGLNLLEACTALFDQKVSDLLSTHPHPKNRAENILKQGNEMLTSEEEKTLLKEGAERIEQVFFWGSKHVMAELNKFKSEGGMPRQKEFIKVVDLDKPAILGIVPPKP